MRQVKIVFVWKDRHLMTTRIFQRQATSRFKGQRGQVAIILAFLITFIILMLGLVIDSVRLYILGTQAIRAAEAGALAGALYMPDYFDSNPPSLTSPDGNTAVSRACLAVQQNGITNCPASAGVDGAMVSRVAGNQYEIQVTVTLTANVFFLDYVIPNLSTATVSRSSIAEFLPPIQLGSRTAAFGDEADGVQQFWATINGPSELKEQGDAYTPIWEEGPTDPINYPDASSSIYHLSRYPAQTCPTDCTNHQQWSSPIANPDQQPTGFTYADGSLTVPGYNYEIVVPPGVGNVQVQIFNPVFDPSASSTLPVPKAGGSCCMQTNNITGDSLGSACDDPAFAGSPCKTDKSTEYMQMHYALYSAPLPFSRSADTLLAKFSPASLDYYGDHCTLSGATPAWDPVNAYCLASPAYVENWYTLYTITSPGTYRLVAAATGAYGFHNYGIRLVDSSGSPATDGPRIWGWGDMCVHFNLSSTTQVFDLGEIPASYAGKTLNFSLFDPGEGTTGIQILDPSGNAVVLPSWVRTVTGSGGTEIDPTGGYYNGLWLHMPITIPSSYNPAPGSDWWQIKYSSGGSTTDTTTISISLSGSPVHLISEVL